MPEAPREDLARLLETELLRLGACEARLDLELGLALRSCRIATVQQLGFSSLDSYCPEALGFSRRVASELISLSDRLSKLPRLREAFLAGALARSRVRIACSIATPETELRWMLACLRSSTRDLQALAKAERQRLERERRERERRQAKAKESPGPDASEDDAGDHVRVRLRASSDDLAFVNLVGIPMLQAVLGQSGPTHALFEALAADTLAELGPETECDPSAATAEFLASAERSRKSPGCSGEDGDGHEHEHDVSPRMLQRAEKRMRQSLHRLRNRLGGLPAVAWPVPPANLSSPATIHARLMHLSTWRNGLAWQRGRLLSLIHERGLWRELRHLSFHEWTERRLGLGPQEVRRLLTLSKTLASLPSIDAAWRDGHVDPASASLLRQVATPDTEADWLRLVASASRKRVEVEVAAQLALRSQLGWSRAHERTGGRPQWNAASHDLLSRWADEIERRIRARRARQAAGAPKTSSGSGPDSPFDLDGSLSDRGACERDLLAGPPLGRKQALLAFDAPPQVAALLHEALRQVARAASWTLDVGGCLVVMLHRFAETHVVEGLAERGLRARILRRDGWRCFMPRCRARRHLDVHHVIFRSRGGRDVASNLITLCHRCHRLLHEGRLGVTGAAPSGLLVRMGREAPGCPVEWFREGIRVLPEHDLTPASPWGITSA